MPHTTQFKLSHSKRVHVTSAGLSHHALIGLRHMHEFAEYNVELQILTHASRVSYHNITSSQHLHECQLLQRDCDV